MAWGRRISTTRSWLFSGLAFVALSVSGGLPLQAQILQTAGGDTFKRPVFFQAEQIDYDQPNDVIVASGQVEIVQGDSIILADTLIYDRKRGQVQAMGHVSMLEPSGHVLFADSLALTDDLKSGVISQFKARLSDDSLFAAENAKKLDESRFELFRAAYTPCDCGSADNPENPTWSLRAKHVKVDQAKQTVRYKHAYLDVAGVPVLYTPYFSHPTPDAENQSGLLMPEFLQSRNLGAVYKQPIYYAIAPDRDLTLTPIFTTQEGQVLAGSYRQQFDTGYLKFNGSFTNSERKDDLGNRTRGREWRGHIDTRASFLVDEHYSWGYDIRRASDETYLRLYNFSNDPFLNSRLYADGMNFIGESDRSYASIEALSFQGLTDDDASAVIPFVAPLVNVVWQSDPLAYHSRLTLEGGTMALFRDRGSQSRRVSSTLRWTLPYLTEGGQIFEFQSQVRSDMYYVDSVQLRDGRDFEGSTGRIMPQASLQWRYPFINRMEAMSMVVEPVVSLIASPGGGNPEKIPNEDSLLPDFNDANLFSASRYAGFDRVENGPRATYGLRAEAQADNGVIVDVLAGQQYRLISDVNFPTSNDLGSSISDYVGRFGANYKEFGGSYRFRLDQENLASRRNELEFSYTGTPLALTTTYLKLKGDPILADREIVNGFATLDITDNWGVIANGSHDLELRESIRINGGVVYKNECVNITTMVGKDYTNILDVKPSLSFWVRVSLKNLD